MEQAEVRQLAVALVEVEAVADEELVGDDEADVPNGEVVDEAPVGPVEQRHGRDLLIVEDVVDTGLTLNYLVRTLELRGPASVAAATLLDRPYRRLVDDLPVRYVGFTVPDELYVGYGFDLDERYRELPDLRLLNL